MSTIAQPIAPGGRLVIAAALSPLEVHLVTCTERPWGLQIGDGFFGAITSLPLSISGDGQTVVLDSGNGGFASASGRGSISVGGSNSGIISTGANTVTIMGGGRPGVSRGRTSEPAEGTLLFMPPHTSIITPTATSTKTHDCVRGQVTIEYQRPNN